MKKRIKLLGALCLLVFMNFPAFSQDPPPPPSQGGESGGAVGGAAPIGGGTLILVVLGSVYLVYKHKINNYKKE